MYLLVRLCAYEKEKRMREIASASLRWSRCAVSFYTRTLLIHFHAQTSAAKIHVHVHMSSVIQVTLMSSTAESLLRACTRLNGDHVMPAHMTPSSAHTSVQTMVCRTELCGRKGGVSSSQINLIRTSTAPASVPVGGNRQDRATAWAEWA